MILMKWHYSITNNSCCFYEIGTLETDTKKQKEGNIMFLNIAQSITKLHHVCLPVGLCRQINCILKQPAWTIPWANIYSLGEVWLITIGSIGIASRYLQDIGSTYYVTKYGGGKLCFYWFVLIVICTMIFIICIRPHT